MGALGGWKSDQPIHCLKEGCKQTYRPSDKKRSMGPRGWCPACCTERRRELAAKGREYRRLKGLV